MYRLVRSFDGAVIICYVQGKNVREVGDFDFGADPIGMMHEYFAREIEIATAAGLEKIFIDPGLGFYYRNLQDSSVRVAGSNVVPVDVPVRVAGSARTRLNPLPQ